MTLITRRSQYYNPFQELEKIQNEIGRLFGSSLSKKGESGVETILESWSPAMDVIENKDSYVIKADLPGLTKDQIDVSIDKDVLTIKGEKKQEEKVEKENYLRSERFEGIYYRSVSLPSNVDTSNIKAEYQNGTLQLTLPKKEESKPKQVRLEVK